MLRSDNIVLNKYYYYYYWKSEPSCQSVSL